MTTGPTTTTELPAIPPLAGRTDSTDSRPNHKTLVRKSAAWLRNRKNCNVVFAELATQNNETPDVIGFHGAGGSILVECKTSRADFLADKNKIFRHHEEMGMGDARYFAAPKGLLKPDELPEGWGLLEITDADGRTYETKQATYKEANKRAEVKMLMSAIRRLEISTAVFVRAEEENSARPDMVARWAKICHEAHDRDEAWIAMLRREGIKAAHPDDGWVDRENNTVHFAYPQFNDGAGIGDKIALGWASDKWRIVTITGRADGLLLERWAFSSN